MARSVVVFGEDWGAHPSSTQHLFRRLAEDRDVIWVNSLGLRRPTLTRKDITRAVAKVRKSIFGSSDLPKRATSTSAPARLTTIDPRAISWPGSRIASAINRFSVGTQVRAALKNRDLRRPVLWASLPSAVSVLDQFENAPVIYYCGDDFGALAGVDHAPVRDMESRLVDRADVILAASDELAAQFPAEKTVTLPHGVDFELFSQPAPRAKDLPVGKPIAGFYGSLAEWLDIDRLVATAKDLPDWNFVLIGSGQVDLGELVALPNVHLLGARPHGALPGYSQHWNVSLLPFRNTRQIQACNPLKLREYLAAGTPIVTTDFPAIAPYRDRVFIASESSSYAEAILQAAPDRVSNPLRRMSVATEGWSQRAAYVADLMESL
jgi:glycosyltransferase involved in cell wall biosynthesis